MLLGPDTRDYAVRSSDTSKFLEIVSSPRAQLFWSETGKHVLGQAADAFVLMLWKVHVYVNPQVLESAED